MLERPEPADKSVTFKERDENKPGRPGSSQYHDNKRLVCQTALESDSSSEELLESSPEEDSKNSSSESEHLN